MKAIAKYLDKEGIYNVKVKDIHHHLTESMPTFKVPSIPTLNKILTEKFYMRFGRLQTTTTKYFEGTYSEKRLWVSRLLAQFFLDGAIIISVDESNFKSELTKNWCWQFNNPKMNNVFRAVQEEVKVQADDSSDQSDLPPFDPESHLQLIPSYSKTMSQGSDASAASSRS